MQTEFIAKVAPAAEMENEGINVSKMNTLLLKKIEELTCILFNSKNQLRIYNPKLKF
ncbi:MAG: hypothetical protein LBU90_03120 [Bacteroidales bacterium]|jgi:hypothetical protein|nr:hypothetical protein [Bacteroidales bacterium]